MEEIEALEAIYPDMFTLVSKSPLQYTIKILPESEDGTNHVGVILVCNIPTSYPNECSPELTVQMDKGLTKVQMEELSQLAINTAAENMGSPCIFIVAEALREWLGNNNIGKAVCIISRLYLNVYIVVLLCM